MNIKRAIVTGGAGFIGSHLVDALVRKGLPVVVVDDLRRGSLRNLERHCPEMMYDHIISPTVGRMPGVVEVCNCPVEEVDWIGIDQADAVFHLAATVTNIEANRHNHLGMLQANLSTNMAVIEAMRWKRPGFFMAASTVCVYPHSTPTPTPEQYGWPLDPEPTNQGYGIAKGVLEKQSRYLYQECGVPTLIVRFSNAIGERDYYDPVSSHVVPALIRKAFEEDEVVVWGTGTQRRVFVDARDIARAVVALYDTPATHIADPINIGHDREISMDDLAHMIVDMVNPLKGVSFDTSKPNGHERRLVSTNKLLTATGWLPDTPLEDTLKRMILEFSSGRSHTEFP